MMKDLRIIATSIESSYNKVELRTETMHIMTFTLYAIYRGKFVSCGHISMILTLRRFDYYAE